MKTACVHYFTGTGNTASVAEQLAQGLRERGYLVALVPAATHENRGQEPGHYSVGGFHSQAMPSSMDGASPQEADLRIIAFPVYSFAMPQVMRRHVQALPRGRGAKAAVVATMGGGEGGALNEARRMLRRRGYDVVLTATVLHVSNFTQVYSPPPPAEQQRLEIEAAGRVRQIIDDLESGQVRLKKCGLVATAISKPLSVLFRLIGRRYLGKLYAADSRCDGCELCWQSCPVGAIRPIFRRPRWKLSCQACQRCINLCPNEAIQTSLVRLVAGLALLAVPYHKLLWPLVAGAWAEHYPAGAVTAKVGLYIVGYLVACLVADKVLFAMEWVPGLRSVLSWGLSRRFRRYLHPDLKERLSQDG